MISPEQNKSNVCFGVQKDHGFSLIKSSSISNMQLWLRDRSESDDGFDPIPFDIECYESQSDSIVVSLEDTLDLLLHDEECLGKIPNLSQEEQTVHGAVTLEQNSSTFTNQLQDANELQDDDTHEFRFRSYQANQWDVKFQELLDYQNERGHCSVPHSFPLNPSLGRWVKRQRYQYKLMLDGKDSTMTQQRSEKLEKAGFVWDAHSMAWDERLQDLLQYLSKNGDCNVPTIYLPNRQLATWVKCQRRQYKLFRRGKTSTINLDRIRKLNMIGFTWELRAPRMVSK